jgi:hypothetical protein
MIPFTKTFASHKLDSIVIRGRGFQVGMGLILDPPLLEHLDYDLLIHSENQANLLLREGKHWRGNEHGFILCKSVMFKGQIYHIHGEEGIKIAWIVPDPPKQPTISERVMAFIGWDSSKTTNQASASIPAKGKKKNGVSLQMQILMVVTYTLGMMLVLIGLAIFLYRFRYWIFCFPRATTPSTNHPTPTNTAAAAPSTKEQKPTSTGGDVSSSR